MIFNKNTSIKQIRSKKIKHFEILLTNEVEIRLIIVLEQGKIGRGPVLINFMLFDSYLCSEKIEKMILTKLS